MTHAPSLRVRLQVRIRVYLRFQKKEIAKKKNNCQKKNIFAKFKTKFQICIRKHFGGGEVLPLGFTSGVKKMFCQKKRWGSPICKLTPPTPYRLGTGQVSPLTWHPTCNPPSSPAELAPDRYPPPL